MTTYTENVRRYLVENFDAVPADVDAALGTDASKATIAKYEREQSFPYYTGDRIAEANGWAELAEPAEGAYDGVPADDGD